MQLNENKQFRIEIKICKEGLWIIHINDPFVSSCIITNISIYSRGYSRPSSTQMFFRKVTFNRMKITRKITVWKDLSRLIVLVFTCKLHNNMCRVTAKHPVAFPVGKVRFKTVVNWLGSGMNTGGTEKLFFFSLIFV